MKHKFIKVLLLIGLLCLFGCTAPIEKFEHKVSFDLCAFDSYRIQDGDLVGNLDDYTFETEDLNICVVDDYGKIKTNNVGQTKVYARNLVDEDLNTEITVTTEVGLRVDFINVGQGDAILIMLPNGKTMMIDAGAGLYFDDTKAWQNIQYTFMERGIKEIDYFIITHNHSDHYALVPRVIREYKINSIYGSGSMRTNYEFLNIMQSIKDAGLTYNAVAVGEYLIQDGDLKVQVVGVQKDLNEDYGNPNANSVMLKLTYRNISYMFTGDAGHREGDCEDIALNSGIDLSADVLKVGHHGSTYSSGEKFLQAVKPKYAVMTTVKDSGTGHPHKDAVDRLTKIGATLYQSAVHGTITISTNGQTIYVYTEKDL